jgi:hydroxyethylthiazole kinase-like uncharacterized protein yjeF
MRRLWHPEEVRELDRKAIHELGLPGIALMECAGAEAAQAVRERYGDGVAVSVLCGPGNNGGDGFVVARHLHVAGVVAGVCIAAAAESSTEDARTMRAAAAAFGVPEREPEDADVIVDALFGSGFRGRLEGAAEALVERANGLAAPIVALDVPSGVDGASGRVEGSAIQAALTLAFHGRTLGTAIEPGRGHAGELIELPIGLPGALAGPARALRMDPSDLALVPGRSPTGSKYDAGSVLVVGGSPGMSGAPALAALAALRGGAGVRRSQPTARSSWCTASSRPSGFWRSQPAPAPWSPDRASVGLRPRPSSSTRSCMGWRSRWYWMPTRCSRSAGGWSRFASAPARPR